VMVTPSIPGRVRNPFGHAVPVLASGRACTHRGVYEKERVPSAMNEDTRRETLGGSVYDRLKSDIVSWAFKPGQRLPEGSIAERFGVSRTPVREALLRLEQEGLVVYVPQHGYSARTLNLKGLNELYQVRVVLEEWATGLAAEVARDGAEGAADLEELRTTWEQRVRETPSPGDPDLVYADETFHETIARVCGNEHLLDLLRSINEKIRIIRIFDFRSQERIATTYEEHVRVIRHVTRGEVEKGKKTMREHIENSQRHVSTNAMQALLEMQG
jgi:DNA-binding GntR family transcriptional regulator